MKLGDRNLRFALLNAVHLAIKAELDAERADHTADLRELYEDSGVKSMDVKLPGGSKVATISLSVPKASTDVVDEAALLEWATESAPWLVETIHHPEVPAYTVPAVPAYDEHRLDREYLAEWVKGVKPTGSGEVVDPDTGEVVPGITHTAEGAPKSFSVRYATDGRDDLARAWRDGELEHLTGGSVLPAIGGGE